MFFHGLYVPETRVYWVQGSNGNGNHVSNSAQLHWSASVVDAEKTGDYTCVASNDVDKDTFTIRIIVECKLLSVLYMHHFILTIACSGGTHDIHFTVSSCTSLLFIVQCCDKRMEPLFRKKYWNDRFISKLIVNNQQKPKHIMNITSRSLQYLVFLPFLRNTSFSLLGIDS